MLKLVAPCAVALLIASTLRAQDQDPNQDDLRYLQAKEAALAAADALPASDRERGNARFSALQMLASALTTVGDHASATRVYSEGFYAFGNKPLPLPGETTVESPEFIRSVLDGRKPESAISAIVRAARNRQLVILNESHQMSRHRAFGMQLALALRKIGFTHLAMETLAPRTDALAKRGYPLRDDGWYSKDPVFGDFIRQALRAGYIPVAYEQTPEQRPDAEDWATRIDAREENQANNLVERVLKENPRARIFIYAGFGHAFKGSETVDGKAQKWMAERLRAKTGIDPLCIDETRVRDTLPGSRDRALIDAIFSTTRHDSVVLADVSKPGQHYAFDLSRVDMQVFHRTAKVVETGRESWLSMNGYRRPRDVPAELLPERGRRLIQAFVADESADAVPMDQVLVEAGRPPPKLMLPRGNYRFTMQE